MRGMTCINIEGEGQATLVGLVPEGWGHCCILFADSIGVGGVSLCLGVVWGRP